MRLSRVIARSTSVIFLPVATRQATTPISGPEILDADGFAAFKQAEDIWDPELAGRLKRWVYEAGGLCDELYRNFPWSRSCVLNHC